MARLGQKAHYKSAFLSLSVNEKNQQEEEHHKRVQSQEQGPGRRDKHEHINK